MTHDKKAVEGRLTFILLDGIGGSVVEASVDPALVRSLLLAAGAV
jgi:3-dehydroquinate synthetase